MTENIVFRCCKNCGSAEEVLQSQIRCPGCGGFYSNLRKLHERLVSLKLELSKASNEDIAHKLRMQILQTMDAINTETFSSM